MTTRKPIERECHDCGIEFTTKNTNKGRINQCQDCSESDETIRAIGYNDGQLNKMQSTGIYRGGNKQTIKKLLGFRMV